MVQYFSKAFFGEIANRLNEDTEWAKNAGNLSVKLVLTCVDRGSSFLLDIQAGKITAVETAPDAPADFKFEGPYDAWVQLGRGEKDLQGLVLAGKMKFRGSLPRIMGMMGQLGRLTQMAQQIPKEF